jgi:hypothetical protein
MSSCAPCDPVRSRRLLAGADDTGGIDVTASAGTRTDVKEKHLAGQTRRQGLYTEAIWIIHEQESRRELFPANVSRNSYRSTRCHGQDHGRMGVFWGRIKEAQYRHVRCRLNL